jgi:hypothetical protein
MSDSDIPVSDNFAPVPGVKYEDEAAPAAQAEQAAPVKVEEAPVETPVNEPPVEPAETEETKDPAKDTPRDPETGKYRKAGPIAKLLETKHTLETELETERKARLELEAKLQAQASQPQSSQSDEDIKALAEEFGLDETLLARIVSTARKGSNPELPKEVQDLLQERAAQKQEQAEREAFDKRVDALAKALPTESFSDPKVREKLLELAYSTEKAPDGELYYQKELSELYFAYIKPEIEPGKPSAEPSQGGTQATKVIDFEEIYNRDDPKDIDGMDSDTFTKYNAWVKEHKESKTPLKRTG